MQNKKYSFDEEKIEDIRTLLLEWYNKNKRDLPWRRAALHAEKQQHAYAVWVSEIMLQQTRVATVIKYYKKWMSCWPTLADLSKASLEEVNEIWAGLGYYSRARRLREAAMKVMTSLNGMIPQTSSVLVKEMPGVGRYTAAAIASIAFDESVGVLDGNVIRVLCRLLTIGGDSTAKKVLDHLWTLVDDLIPEQNAGDFNQAMMELGALVCTPKNPACNTCPLKSMCRAYKQVENHKVIIHNKSIFEGANGSSKKRKNSNSDTENAKKRKTSFTGEKQPLETLVDIESCADYLASPSDISWDPKLGVMNYPRKPTKKRAREETALVCVLEVQSEGKVNNDKSSSNSHFLLVQRPNHGLLAGLWEFPTQVLNEREFPNVNAEEKSNKVLKEFSNSTIKMYLGNCDIAKRRTIPELTHIFSHIHMKYVAEHVVVYSLLTLDPTECEHQQKTKWVTKDELRNSAVSSAMHKIYGLCFNTDTGTSKQARTKMGKEDTKQIKIDKFFKIKSE